MEHVLAQEGAFVISTVTSSIGLVVYWGMIVFHNQGGGNFHIPVRVVDSPPRESAMCSLARGHDMRATILSYMCVLVSPLDGHGEGDGLDVGKDDKHS